jgi:hypothetical protein
MYTLKLTINFVAHLTFHVLKLKLFMCDDQKLNRKQKVWVDVNAIEHRFAVKINAYFVQSKHISKASHHKKVVWMYLVKHKGCHQKKAVWMKPTHLNHLRVWVHVYMSNFKTLIWSWWCSIINWNTNLHYLMFAFLFIFIFMFLKFLKIPFDMVVVFNHQLNLQPTLW